jgi:hypothetical protein
MPARLKAGVSVQTDKKPRSSQLLVTQKELAEEAVISEPVSRSPVGSLFHGKIQGNSPVSGLAIA